MRTVSRILILAAVGLTALGGAVAAKPSDPSDRPEPVGAAPAVQPSAAPAASPKITPAQAQVAALTANPGSSARDVELQTLGGQLVFAVGLDRNTEVLIDAGSGKVVSTGPDPADQQDEAEGADQADEADQPDEGGR